MDKSLIKFEILSTIFIFIFGVLLHFTYKWSGNNIFIGTFSAVNESTWEHLKLIFFPMLFTIIIGRRYLKNEYPNYLSVKTKGLLLSLLFIVVFFYTSSGIIGKNIDLINISSFFVAVFLEEYYTYKKLQKNIYPENNIFSLLILLILFLCFVTFTFFTPHLGIFRDPLTNMYGI